MYRPCQVSLISTIVITLLALNMVGQRALAQETIDRNLIIGGDFAPHSDLGTPDGFSAAGNVSFGQLGDAGRERFGVGYRLLSAVSEGSKALTQGSVTTTVTHLTSAEGRWFRFRIRGLAQKGFLVDQDDLYLKVHFFSNAGKDDLDDITRQFYEVVKLDQAKLLDNGTNPKLGPSSWRSYDLDFRTPFPEVDTVELTVGFGMGMGSSRHAEFWIGSEDLTTIPVPADYHSPTGGTVTVSKELLPLMVPLGGRWYYDPRGGDPVPPKKFDYTNGNRLFYLSDRLESPFADNMTSYLRKGDVGLDGSLATADTPVLDNVVVTFTSTSLVIHSKNLPNHATAVFPDVEGLLDGNPNYIREGESTWYIPLNPVVNPDHIAMENGANSNRALPMGPIGVAVNGIVFFNPFDAGSQEALWRVDRCCGHPAPSGQYHYHKYPVCIKSPWADDGTEHSPLIGFAFDGFPIYGPYEEKGVMAKDDKLNPLNSFNMHFDKERGWHYHVTPGVFPHIIGGYWGYLNRDH